MNQPTSVGHSASDEIRAWYRKIGKGWRTWTPEQRSIASSLNASKAWATRRLRYGKTGMRDKPYSEWLKARNMTSQASKLR